MTIKPVRGWELERYLLDELPSQRMEEISRLLEDSPEMQSELERLQQSNTDFFKEFPPETVIPNIQRRHEAEKASKKKKERPVLFKRLLYASPALASALVILFIVLLNPSRDMTEDTRIKGTPVADPTKPHILIHRKIDSDTELLHSGDRAEEGDLLQLAYVPAGQSYGVIFSIDGKGLVTLHFPENQTDSTLLLPKERVLLPSAYELDDAPEFERFFFITSQTEIHAGRILEMARSLARNAGRAKKENLELPYAYDQYTTLIIKGE
jgi:hypothetical protein